MSVNTLFCLNLSLVAHTSKPSNALRECDNPPDLSKVIEGARRERLIASSLPKKGRGAAIRRAKRTIRALAEEKENGPQVPIKPSVSALPCAMSDVERGDCSFDGIKRPQAGAIVWIPDDVEFPDDVGGGA